MFLVHEKEIHPGPAFGCENQKRKGKTKMKSKKAVRSALGMSVLSIALCAAMLIGTTFAWFTDTATTSVNKIQSGTLDIALEMKDNAGKWVSAEGKTLQFLVNGKIPAQKDDGTYETILWEPGCTYVLPQLRVRNNGNLALKYKVAITGIQGDTGLAKVIEWTYTGETDTFDLSAEHHLKAKVDDNSPADVFTIKAHMLESAGNEYQGKSIENIAITVVATQDTVESDSKDNQYDADAIYPVVAAATVNTEGSTVLKDKEVDHNVKLTAPAGSVAAGATSLKLTVDTVSTPAGITVSDTQNSQTFEVKLVDQNGNKVTAADEALFTVEMNVGTGRTGLKLYHDGVLMTKDDGSLTDAADHYVYNATTGYVTMKVSHFSPFTAVFNKGNWSDTVKEDADYATPVDESAKVVTIASAEELALFAKQVTGGTSYKGYTISITKDIDLSAHLWNPINAHGSKLAGATIEGHGNIIENMVVRSCLNTQKGGYGFAFIGDIDDKITIQNITFDNASVSAHEYLAYSGNIGGVVLGYTYGTTLFDNVKVSNSEIWGYGKIGPMLGMGADPGVKVTFKDCVSKNNTINAAYDMGGLAGMIQRGDGVDNGSVKNCTVENITVNYDPASTYVDVKGTATFKSNDQPSGTDVTRDIDGKYFDEAGYYWCGYGDYYVSYGNSSYDAPVDGYNKCLANSEYSVNK